MKTVKIMISNSKAADIFAGNSYGCSFSLSLSNHPFFLQRLHKRYFINRNNFHKPITKRIFLKTLPHQPSNHQV